MWVLIPIKRFELAKTRLAGRYPAPQRADVARSLATIALRAALAARGVQRVVALTADPDARCLCRTEGAEVLDEAPDARDLSTLLAAAFDALARQEPPDALVYLASDLPHLRPASIEQLRAGWRGGVGVGRAIRDGGTNALIFAAPRRFEFAFGVDSARRHCQNARRAGLPARLHDIPGISHDLDLPHEARAFAARAAGGSRA